METAQPIPQPIPETVESVAKKSFFDKFKNLWLPLLVLIIISIVGWFTYQQFFKEKSVNLGQITYGWNIWPGELPFLVAYDQGFFKQEGLEVKLVEEDSYGKMLDNFRVGKSDVITMALIDVAEKVSKGERLKIVSAVDYSNGADGIVAKKEIKSISGLKGKKVAVEMGTLGEYLLNDAIKKNNLTLSDIKEVNLSAQEAAQAFIRGEVDVAVTYEPDYSQAVEKGNGWRIYTSANSPGLIIDVLTFKTALAEKNPEKVTAIIKAYIKAMDFIANNPDKSFEIGAKYFKITPNEFKEQYKGVKQVGLNENLDYMTYGSSTNSLHRLIKEAYDFLNLAKSTTGNIDSTGIVDPQFLRGLAK